MNFSRVTLITVFISLRAPHVSAAQVAAPLTKVVMTNGAVGIGDLTEKSAKFTIKTELDVFATWRELYPIPEVFDGRKKFPANQFSAAMR